MTEQVLDFSAERAAIAALQQYQVKIEAHRAVLQRHRDAAAAAEKAAENVIGVLGADGDVEAVAAILAARDAAHKTLGAAEAVQGAMAAREGELRRAVLDAHADAFRAQMRHAASEAIEAAKDGEAAIAAYGGAVKRYEAAAELAMRARNEGVTPPFSDGGQILLQHRHPTTPVPPALARILRAPAAERAIWGAFAP